MKEMTKQELRHKIRGLRTFLNNAERLAAAENVFARLEATAAFQLAEKILMYHSLPDELETREFMKKWRNIKRFYLPRVNGVNLEILPYDETRLEIGSFHIEEPTGNDTVSSEEIELMVIPGVAFDRSARRLGRGKGFYDRLLKETKATKIGVGYEFQLVDELPSEDHDVPMDIVITEQTIIIRGK